MKPKFFISLIVTLLLGGSIGYMLGKGGSESGANDDAGADQRKAPRFGELVKAPTSGDVRNPNAVYNNSTSVDSLLLKYSRMTPEQIQAEIKAMGDLGLNARTPDIKKLMSMVYLSYKWGQLSPQQALLESESLGPMGMLTVPMIFQGWAEQNPEAAAAYYIENKKRMPHGFLMLGMIGTEMGKSSPETAMSWLGSLDEKERNGALSSVMAGIAENHPEQLKANIGKLTPDDLKNSDLVGGIAAKWAASNWEETNEWIKSLPQEEQAKARASAIAGLASKDLEKATEEFKTLETKDQVRAAESIVSQLAMNGGTKALEWVVKNTDETVGSQVVSSAIGYGSSYTQQEEMKDYIVSLPDGSVKDSSLENLIGRNVRTFDGDSVDYKNNVELASTITDEKKRNNATSSVLRRWVENDPATAKGWVESNASLSAEMKERYIKRADEKIAEKND